MTETTYVAGTLLRIDKYEDDENVYTVTQVPYESQTPKIVQGLEEDRVEIDWSFGVGKTAGYVMKSTLEIGVEVHILGIKLGTFYGNLKDGLLIKVNLFAEKGQVQFYLKNGHEVWESVEIQGVGTFHKDMKLFAI